MIKNTRNIFQFLKTWLIRKTPSSFVASVLLSYGGSRMNIPWEYLKMIPFIGDYAKYLSMAPSWVSILIIFCVTMAVIQAVRAWLLARMLISNVIPTFLDDKNCILLTDLTGMKSGQNMGKAYYVRVRIDNKRDEAAEGISVQLVNISIKRGNNFESTTFRTPLKLKGGEKFSIEKRIPEYVNVFYITTDGIVKLETNLNEYKGVFFESGFYKLDIQISEKNAFQRISLLYEWSGLYERPKVTLLSRCNN